MRYVINTVVKMRPIVHEMVCNLFDVEAVKPPLIIGEGDFLREMNATFPIAYDPLHHCILQPTELLKSIFYLGFSNLSEYSELGHIICLLYPQLYSFKDVEDLKKFVRILIDSFNQKEQKIIKKFTKLKT